MTIPRREDQWYTKNGDRPHVLKELSPFSHVGERILKRLVEHCQTSKRKNSPRPAPGREAPPSAAQPCAGRSCPRVWRPWPGSGGPPETEHVVARIPGRPQPRDRPGRGGGHYLRRFPCRITRRYPCPPRAPA